jgi:hypothetical protein
VLLLDERRAIEAIPVMLDREPELAARMANNLRALLGVVGVSSSESKARLGEVEEMFKVSGSHRAAGRTGREHRELEPITTERARPARGAKHA